jgi:hypothetical protein
VVRLPVGASDSGDTDCQLVPGRALEHGQLIGVSRDRMTVVL